MQLPKLKRKPRTKNEIDIQIAGLKAMKITLPRRSAFGDDNHAKIDAQISVLEGNKKPDYFYVDETSDEFQDGDNDVYSSAVDAEEWMNGDKEDNLFE